MTLTEPVSNIRANEIKSMYIITYRLSRGGEGDNHDGFSYLENVIRRKLLWACCSMWQTCRKEQRLAWFFV